MLVTLLLTVGLVAALNGLTLAWLAVCLFGVLGVGAAADLIRAPRLEVGRLSFAKVDSFGRRTEYDFARCGPFEVYRQPLPYRSGEGPACVAFNYEGARGRLARANRRVAGSNTYLNAVFSTSAAELSALLNEHRDAFNSSRHDA
jgi:hypothetical protein